MHEVHRFNRFEVCPQRRQLLVDGQPLAVGARAFDVLLALIEKRGQLVTKSELFDAVWPGRVVEDNNLVVQVGTLRKLLGPEVITTIPGRGYRFTALPLIAEAGASLPAGPHPLVTEVMPLLIGREDDLVALGAILSTHRQVTLSGPGGIGKTRVARQLAHDRAAEFEHGVAWIDLAGLADPNLVPAAVASALGLQLAAGDLNAGLLNWLRSRHLLLVIDNAEHLLEAVAAMVRRLIDGAPRLRILVTSQTPLHESAERMYRLGPLEVPDDTVAPSEALEHGAVRLFVERTQSIDRGFSLVDANCAGVVAICRKLDGLPLAIELAAARMPLLGVNALASALDARLQWLTAGRRSAPPRQRTLRAALEWTCDLLGDAESKVLRRLSVFAGGFTLDMARAVAADPDDDGVPALGEWDVTEALAVLVDRSLVAADTAAEPRYRLLESPRAYAAELLTQAGELDSVRQRHARHLSERYARASDDWFRISDTAWLHAYPVEADNIRVAIAWALGPGGDMRTGMALIAASSRMWTNIGLYAEALARQQQVLASVDASTPAALRADLWLGLGHLTVNGTPADAIHAFEAAAAGYRECAHALGLAHALISLARALASTGRLEAAVRQLDEAQAQLERESSDKLRGRHADVLGFVLSLRGDHEGAIAAYRRALGLYRAAGSATNELNMLLKFAGESWSVGDLETAAQGFQRAAETLRQSAWATKGMLGVCLTNLAGVLTERLQLDEALVAARAGLPLRQEAGYAWGALDHLALRAALGGRADDAARLAGCADATYAAKAAARQPNEARARARLQALLLESQHADQLLALLEEGSGMSIAQACRLALAA